MGADMSAQDAYRVLLREHVAPALRALGFTGAPSRGTFRYEAALHAAEVRFQKSRYSRTGLVNFWVLLHAVDRKTEWVYWDWTLHSLASRWGDAGDWTLRTGDPAGPLAGEVIHSLTKHAWPAIQAALDNPGYPPDPAVRWARTFPKRPRGPRFDDEIAADERAREELDDWMDQAESDPRATAELLTRLETDPDPGARASIAWYLLPRAREEHISRALRAASAGDENVEVRWTARYALRLAEDPR